MARLPRLLTAGGLAALIVLGWATAPIDPGPPLAMRAPEDVTPAVAAAEETLLRPRETLEAALVRSGFARTEARELIGLLRGTVDMRRLRPGERLSVSRGPDDVPVAAIYWRSPVERYEITRGETGWALRAVRVPVDTRI